MPTDLRFSYVQGPVSRKSRELFGPGKSFVKLRPACSVKLVFSYVVNGIKIKITATFRAFVLKIQRELCHPKYTRKVSGLSRNRPQVPKSNANFAMVSVNKEKKLILTTQ